MTTLTSKYGSDKRKPLHFFDHTLLSPSATQLFVQLHRNMGAEISSCHWGEDIKAEVVEKLQVELAAKAEALELALERTGSLGVQLDELKLRFATLQTEHLEGVMKNAALERTLETSKAAAEVGMVGLSTLQHYTSLSLCFATCDLRLPLPRRRRPRGRPRAAPQSLPICRHV